MLEKYLTPTQVANKLGLTRQAVHRMINEGRIKFERIGKQYFITKADVDKVCQHEIRKAKASA